MKDVEKRLRERLFAMQDPAYRDFQARLIPTVAFDNIIGVRTPALRRFAKELAGESDAEAFCACLPHRYYEENTLHAFLIEPIRDYDALIQALDTFLPYVDNWATCDSLSPVLFRRRPDRLLDDIDRWMASEHPFAVRFGIGMLMKWYLDDGVFEPRFLEKTAAVRSSAYYVNMMVAWYFATALAKQYDAALPFLERERLPFWTHNKAVQKALESNRICASQKAYLRTLRRGKNRHNGDDPG